MRVASSSHIGFSHRIAHRTAMMPLIAALIFILILPFVQLLIQAARRGLPTAAPTPDQTTKGNNYKEIWSHPSNGRLEAGTPAPAPGPDLGNA
jgi:hypothetical protein